MRDLAVAAAELDIALLASPQLRREARDIPSGERLRMLLDKAEAVLNEMRRLGLAPEAVPSRAASLDLFEHADREEMRALRSTPDVRRADGYRVERAWSVLAGDDLRD